jgi:hypothetical protein
VEGGGVMLPMPKPGQRVCVTLPFAGLRAMQVCAVEDATDKEILEVCNRENPQMVTGGWHTVVRTKEQVDKQGLIAKVSSESALPGKCVECPGRLHIIVLCM